MAFRALTGLAEQWFEPERWELKKNGELAEKELNLEEGEQLTRILLKPLNGKEYYSVLQNMSESNKLACSIGVVGWENFTDFEGKPVEFSKIKVLEYIPPIFIAVIGAKVMEISSVDGKKEKNS